MTLLCRNPRSSGGQRIRTQELPTNQLITEICVVSSHEDLQVISYWKLTWLSQLSWWLPCWTMSNNLRSQPCRLPYYFLHEMELVVSVHIQQTAFHKNNWMSQGPRRDQQQPSWCKLKYIDLISCKRSTWPTHSWKHDITGEITFVPIWG